MVTNTTGGQPQIKITQETADVHNKLKSLIDALKTAIGGFKPDPLIQAWEQPLSGAGFTVEKCDPNDGGGGLIGAVSGALANHHQSILDKHLIPLHKALEEKSKNLDAAHKDAQETEEDNKKKFQNTLNDKK